MAYEVSSLGLVWVVGVPVFKASYEDYLRAVIIVIVIILLYHPES